jgi:iron complex transport system substrate-binding protein
MGRLSAGRPLRGPGFALACLLLATAAPAAVAAGATRIVSLAPNLTELLFAAGAGARVVGASEYSDHPAAARAVPRIGNAFRVDFESVLALRPDLVVAWESGTPPEVIERLRGLGLRVIVVRTATLEDIGAALGLLGREAGTTASAARARQQYETQLAALRAAHRGRRSVAVFVEIDDQPLYTVTGQHLISRMIDLCGGRNLFADLPTLAPAIDIESVLERNPDVILVTDPTAPDPVAAWGRYPRLTAVRSGTVLTVPGDLVTRATPRALDGARAVCEALETARRRLPPPAG